MTQCARFGDFLRASHGPETVLVDFNNWVILGHHAVVIVPTLLSAFWNEISTRLTLRCFARAREDENRMFTRARFLTGASALAVVGLLGGPAALAQTSQQVTVDGARKVLNDLRHDKAFGSAAQLMHQAKAVFIVPKLIKGGFIVGGEGGNGVLMVQRHGGWSAPAFYAIGAGSFGLQAGLEQSEMIMLIMTQKGLDGVLRDNFKIGAQAGISVVTLGSGVEGAIGGASLPDVVVWSSSTGLYGGLTVDGSIIRAEPNQDAAFYGRPLSSRDVLFGSVESPRAEPLRRQLDHLG
jgi:lipid-binding SYLF domain-containing protein